MQEQPEQVPCGCKDLRNVKLAEDRTAWKIFVSKGVNCRKKTLWSSKKNAKERKNTQQPCSTFRFCSRACSSNIVRITHGRSCGKKIASTQLRYLRCLDRLSRWKGPYIMEAISFVCFNVQRRCGHRASLERNRWRHTAIGSIPIMQEKHLFISMRLHSISW